MQNKKKYGTSLVTEENDISYNPVMKLIKSWSPLGQESDIQTGDNNKLDITHLKVRGISQYGNTAFTEIKQIHIIY